MKFLFAALLFTSTLAGAAGVERYLGQLRLPSGQTAVIAEGDLEARSLGSFSIRLYADAPAGDETTFFYQGIISERDGTIEKTILADINGDQQAEIIVTMRSAGSGNYLSARAFSIQPLALVAAADNLPPDADPVAALKAALAH